MDSSKDNGGDLGWFTPDRMVKPFSDAVVSLKPGEYTHKPVQTQYGWHVIQLVDTRDLAPPPFDQVKQRLEQVVQAKKFKAYTDDLMKNAKVDKKPMPRRPHRLRRPRRQRRRPAAYRGDDQSDERRAANGSPFLIGRRPLRVERAQPPSGSPAPLIPAASSALQQRQKALLVQHRHPQLLGLLEL